MRRIAVWNTAFLGDLILTLPLLQQLRGAFPTAEITLYTRPGVASFLATHPAINRVVGYDKQKGQGASLAFARALAGEKYDLWVNAHTSVRSGLMAWASRAKMRVGYKQIVGSQLWFTHRVDRRFIALAEIERLLALLEPLGLPLARPWPELFLPEQALQSAIGRFAALTKPVLGMHPGSVWGTKRWAGRHFAAIACLALAQGASVVLFAGPGEEPMAEEVRQLILASVEPQSASRVYSWAGELPLPELAACLGQLDCYLTNDSGPMHLAWAQQTPVVALFGPTTPALGFAPRGEGSVVCELALACRPCSLHGPRTCPRGHHDCMQKLEPALVWPFVQKHLFRGAITDRTS